MTEPTHVGWDERECAANQHPTDLGEAAFRRHPETRALHSIETYCPCGTYYRRVDASGYQLIPKVRADSDGGEL